MSKDGDLESDSPVSWCNLNETKDDINLDDPVSGQYSYELTNDKVEGLDNTQSRF